jgi:excisionase family DNA binding protein
MDELLTPADAARILGVVPATVRQLALKGRLPALRTASGMRLFRREDVEQLREARAAKRHMAPTMVQEEGNDGEAPSPRSR